MNFMFKFTTHQNPYRTIIYIYIAMKKLKENLKERASKKRGKGSAESGDSIKRVDPNDLGDPRGSRSPRSDKTSEIHEKGDEKRPFKNK